jgi:hypothetical protein
MTVGWTNSCSDPVVSIEVRVMEGYNSYWITNWSGTSNSFILTDFSLIGPNRRVLFQFYSFPGGVRRFETEGFVASLAVPPTSVNPTFDQMGPRGFRVKWAGGANLTGTQYQVQLSKFSDFSVMAAEETTTVNPWTASCLEPGTTYFARARTINWDGVPTAYTLLGSTATPVDPPPSNHYSWASGRWELDLSPGTLDPTQTLLFSSDPIIQPVQPLDWETIIQSADQKRLDAGNDPRRDSVLGGLGELAARTGCPANLETQLTHLADLTFFFTSADEWVATKEGRVRVETLRFFRLDPTNALWVKIPTSRTDPALGTVSASVSELGVYTVMGQPDTSLQDVFAFPNPYRRSQGGGITFTQLSEQATLRLFTPSGTLIRTLSESDGDGQLRWDVTNSDGETLAPGVYVCLIESATDKRSLKIVVQP